MATTKKLHGWLIGALEDRGFKRSDLARAWKVDDAVVSRFVASGKPDITIDRIIVLAEMLQMPSDDLIKQLATGTPRLTVPTKAPPPHVSPPPNDDGDTVTDALSAAQAAVKHVQELLPHAKVHFSVVLNNGGEK